jgi:hypothetical protein
LLPQGQIDWKYEKKRLKRWRREALRIWVKHRPSLALTSLCLMIIVIATSDQAERSAIATEQPLADALSLASDFRDTLPENPWGFFRPTWQKTSIWNMIPVKADTFDSLTDTPLTTRSLVDDPDDRIEQEFKVPPSMKSRVQFWVDIYSRFSTRIRVVHDRNDMDIIYGYIDFRPLYRVMGSSKEATARAYQLEKKIVKELKARILEASGETKTNLMSSDERDELRSLLSRAGALGPKGGQKLTQSVRTQTGQSDMFLLALYRSKQLLPHIESVFRQAGLPVGLARIPFVESSFNARAESSVGAVGIWQFMPETAREMIHRDSEHLWADPLRQTKSAMRLLRNYKSVLPDWGCTVIAYNSGVGRVRRITEKLRMTRVEELVNHSGSGNQESLGFAGKNFYAEFLAANIVEAYKEEIFQHLLTPHEYASVFKEKGALPKESCDL